MPLSRIPGLRVMQSQRHSNLNLAGNHSRELQCPLVGLLDRNLPLSPVEVVDYQQGMLQLALGVGISWMIWRTMSSSDPTYHLKGTMRDDMSLIFSHAGALRDVLGYLVGKDLEITVKQFRKRRTDRQNRYIHGVVVVTVQRFYLETQGTHLSHDAVYAKLRRDIGHDLQVVEVDGMEVITFSGKRFSEMTTTEFNESVEQIRQLYAEKGCYILEPNEECMFNDYQYNK